MRTRGPRLRPHQTAQSHRQRHPTRALGSRLRPHQAAQGHGQRHPARTLGLRLRPLLRPHQVAALTRCSHQPQCAAHSTLRYPPLLLGWVRTPYFIVLGALLIAGCAQLQFMFPCTTGYETIEFKGASYCVAVESLAQVTNTTCPAAICSKRIPVTMQTYAVLLNGAIAGRVGALATMLYVVLVCVGAPFGSNGKFDPVWNKGALVGSSGGFFVGFVFASFIMGRCAERGGDRPRSAYWMLWYMLLSELAIYAWGLVWMPFGMAIVKGVSPSTICPDPSSEGIQLCLKNIFNWGMVPFIPGDLIKMFFVLCTVPTLWQLLLLLHKHTGRALPPRSAPLPADVLSASGAAATVPVGSSAAARV